MQKGNRNKICLFCSKPFLTYQDKQKLCSRLCADGIRVGKKVSWGYKIGNALRGKPKSKEHVLKASRAATGVPHFNYRGIKHHAWKGGVTPKNEKIRKSIEYKLWRKSVYERDNYTCVFCGVRGGTLQADHIKPFALFPELRFAIDNGRTLCKPCHRTTETYGRKSLYRKGGASG